MGHLTVEHAIKMASLCSLNFFEGLCEDITYETPELKEKIENYVNAKRELEELLEIETEQEFER